VYSYMSSNHFVFTWNNYTEEDEKSVCALLGKRVNNSRGAPTVTYVLYGREVGEQGTPHLQGYLRLSRKISERTLVRHRRLLDCNFSFLKRAEKSFQANYIYCTKDGNFVELGDKPAQGARNDLIQIRDELLAGADQRDISRNHFPQWVQYRRSFRDFELLQREECRHWKTTVSVFWGSTGTGKTRRAVAEATEHGDGKYWMSWDSSLRWFDGYLLEKCVVLDDFTGDGVDISLMLRLLDRYSFRVPIKGGSVNWQPRWIWITSNKRPQMWFDKATGIQQEALLRRIDEIIEF